MNIKCIICSDLFVPHAEVSTTQCGHLFHFTCLLQWLERSKSCPQCRSRATEKTIHRVFLSLDDTANGSFDAASLQNHVDSLTFQLKMKSMDVDKAREDLAISKDQTLGLRKEVKDLEDKMRTLESAMYALKYQTKHFKSKAKDCTRLTEEADILKRKISQLENVQLAIKGNQDQVDEMLKHNRDSSSLAILVASLKQELLNSNRKTKQVEVLLRDAQNMVHSKVVELTTMSKENASLLQKVEEHKNCHPERQYLKKKIDELRKLTTSVSDAENSFIDRVLPESPVSCLLDGHVSLSSDEEVECISIKESDSPCLPIQPSSGGFTQLFNNYNNHRFLKKSSIFNIPPLKMQNSRGFTAFTSYDGLGGHCKDEHIPSELSQSLKRTKSSSTIPSAKLRKLAPQQKLDKFCKK